MSRRRGAAALQAIPENEEQSAALRDGPLAETLGIIEEIEAQVEARIANILSATEDAIVSMKHDLVAKMVRLPKATREMPLKELQDKFPDDCKTGALQEIRERYAVLAQAVQNTVSATAARAMRTAKRGPEPETVLRTVRPRRAGAAALFVAPARSTQVQPAQAENAAASQPPAAASSAAAATRREDPRASAPTLGSFNGLPLQTPLPFSGAATAMPVTLLTQKRGGRTKAAPAPSAAVITTADGMQWALGKDGMAAIPDTHRTEVQELLNAQYEFLAAALGKTVFQRGGRKGA